LLGNFNPSILNKDFLEINNIIKFEEDPVIKFSPVFNNINYRNLDILIDLNRFQVNEAKISDFSKNIIIDFAYSYLEILKFTPLRTSGINLNINVKITDIDKLLKLLYGKELFDLFEVDGYTFRSNKKINKLKDDEFDNFNLSYMMSSDKLVQIDIQKDHGDIFRVNYNNEVRDLDKNVDNKSYIKKNFNKILEMFHKTTDILFNI